MAYVGSKRGLGEGEFDWAKFDQNIVDVQRWVDDRVGPVTPVLPVTLPSVDFTEDEVRAAMSDTPAKDKNAGIGSMWMLLVGGVAAYYAALYLASGSK
jgi:hypothetical protein